MPSNRWHSMLLYVLGVLIVGLNISTAILNFLSHRHQQATLRDYSFKDADYPSYYPMTLKAGVLTPEDSVHYHIWANESAREFGLTFPNGGGFVFLGPEQRPFGVALYHQMHCLERLQDAFINRIVTNHVHHCFNYIRQAIMCEANPTLEPVMPEAMERADRVLRRSRQEEDAPTGPPDLPVDSGVPRVCKDWEPVRNMIEHNHREILAGNIWW